MYMNLARNCSILIYNMIVCLFYLNNDCIAILKQLDENSKVVKVELFCDRGELLSPLTKGKKSDESASEAPSASGCPFMA